MEPNERKPSALEYASRTRARLNTSGLILPTLFTLAAGILVIFILLPSFVRPRVTTRRGACAASLKAVATACLVYSEGNKGRLPPSLDMLTLGGSCAFLQSKQLVCNATGKPYIYVKNPMNNDDPRQILAFEPLGNHPDGANVAFLDGHVHWCAEAEYRSLLSHAQTRSARTANAE